MDIQFLLGDTKINVRACGVCLREGEVLLHRVEGDSFYGLIGGRVKAGETSEQAIIREYKEELNIEITVKSLAWIAENFFEFNGNQFHEFNFGFVIETEFYHELEKKVAYSQSKRIEFKWFKLDEINTMNIKPAFVKAAINHIDTFNGIRHIISVKE